MVKNDIYFWGISKENVLLWKDAAKKKKKKKKNAPMPLMSRISQEFPD